MFDKAFALIAPHTCCGCGNIGSLICEHCMNDIISESFAQCIVCGVPTDTMQLCRSCAPKTPWDGVWVVGPRTGSLRELIDMYKFERAQEADDLLARLLSHTLPSLPADTAITYVPSIGSHIRQRGYDTMQRVATKLGEARKMEVLRLLERTADFTQRGATRELRLHQQQEALEARSSNHSGPIVLIDDVYTTGGTLHAAATKLKDVYHQPVYVAVIARQPLDDISDL